MAVGAALAAAVLRARPAEPRRWEEPPAAPPGEDPGAAVAGEAAGLLPVLLGFRSEDPAVRRETAGVVERLAADGDPRRRLALAAALRSLGGRESVLSLCLLAGDPDPAVRYVARRALVEEGRR
jgi:HEAT repeat protein